MQEQLKKVKKTEKLEIPKRETWQTLIKQEHTCREEVLTDVRTIEALRVRFEQTVNCCFYDIKEGERWAKNNIDFHAFLIKSKYFLEQKLELFPKPEKPVRDAKTFMIKNQSLFDDFYRAQEALKTAYERISEKAKQEQLYCAKSLNLKIKLDTDFKNEGVKIYGQ